MKSRIPWMRDLNFKAVKCDECGEEMTVKYLGGHMECHRIERNNTRKKTDAGSTDE